MRNINLLNYKKFVLKFSGCALSLPLVFVANSSLSTLKAEVESFLPASMIAEQGQSKTNSLTSGTRATLSLGTSSSFGSSANVSSTDAYSIDARSSFVPTSGSWESSFGKTIGSEGIIKANVGNIRSSGPGTLFKNATSTTFGNSLDNSLSDSENTAEAEVDTPVELNDSSIAVEDSSAPGYVVNATEASTAEGEATLEGVTSDIELVIDPTATFTSTTITFLADNEDTNPMATANGSANQGLSNALNVDLANTSFSNAFSQAF